MEIPDYAKLPPQSPEIEEIILGCLLMDKNSIYEAFGKLKEEHFYVENNALIYKTICELHKESSGIDIITVGEKLKKNGKLDEIGGVVRLAELTSLINSTRNLLDYIEAVIDNYSLREVIRVCGEKMEEAYNGEKEAKEIILSLETDLYKLENNTELTRQPENISKGLSLAVKNIEKFTDHQLTGVTTPFTRLNTITGGWQNQDLIIIGGRPSQGKGLKLDEKILTDTGWIFNKDLKLGQKIASLDGSYSEVTGIFPQGIRQFYKIKFSDGREIECDDQHLWEVHSSRFKGGVRILSTTEIESKLKCIRYNNRMSIPYFSGEYGIEKKFIIHPYILGVLLGDGSLLSSLSWCKEDDEIANRILGYLPHNYTISKYQPQKRCTVWRLISNNRDYTMLEEAKRLGIIGCRSYEKFIPKEYFHSSRQQRLDLLNGLLDTDGSVDKNGFIEYSTSSEILFNDVKQLVLSLGYRCGNSKRIGKLYGVEKKMNYMIRISGKYCGELFTLKRKNERIRHKKYLPLTIFSIERTGKYESQCISVSAKNGLFITKDYIVTHNTQTAIECILSAAKTGVPVLFFSCEMSMTSISTRLISHETGISNEEIRSGLTDDNWKNVEYVIGKLEKLPIIIDDTASIHISELVSKAKRAKIKHNIGLIVVDYLQLLTTEKRGRGVSRDETVGEITKTLKSLAKEIDIPIIALSQLNRMVEQRGDKRPNLSNLRESGDIEAAADIVAFIHNPEYYHDPDAEHCVLELIISKHRNGRIETIKVRRRETWYEIYDYIF